MYSKISCTDTHHDVRDLVNHGMVKNKKTWISGEWNITFIWNKKILNLRLRLHIFRSYCFVVEVTFKCYLKNVEWYSLTQEWTIHSERFSLKTSNKSFCKELKYCKFIWKSNKAKHRILMKKDHCKREHNQICWS